MNIKNWYLKKDYKKAIKMNLKNIEENIDNILDFGFKNNTTKIEITMTIEPDKIVGWESHAFINTKGEKGFMYIEGCNDE